MINIVLLNWTLNRSSPELKHLFSSSLSLKVCYEWFSGFRFLQLICTCNMCSLKALKAPLLVQFSAPHPQSKVSDSAQPATWAALYTQHYTALHTTHWTAHYTLHCTLHTALHTTHWTAQCTLDCTLNNAHCTAHYILHRTLPNAHCTAHYAPQTRLNITQ